VPNWKVYSPMKHIAAIILLTVSLACLAPAQTQTTPATQTSAASQTQTTEYTLPPDKLAKATALYKIGGRLRVITTIWSFAVLLGLLYFGIVARYRDWAERASGRRFAQALIVIPLLLITLNLLDLPFDIYRHHLSLAYGLSVQGWGSWFADLGKGLAISLIIFTVLLWLMMLIIRKSPRRWWFYFWLIALPIVLFIVFIAPFVIEPLFFKFEPLQKTNPELVAQLERVTQRGGMPIPPARMFLMKASEKETVPNAYVTGFGASKRVVVWDTTISNMTTPETLFVFGHEMGHYVLHHVVIGLVLGCLGGLIGLYFVYLISGWTLRRFGARWHIRELSDWAALPMIFLIFAVFSFVSDPISNGVSRYMEHEADRYGLEVTHSINADPQEAAAHSFQRLGELALDYPYPSRFVVFWYYDHPPISERVRFAHSYEPWSKGQPPKYVK
jgi:Zn-dependent protease with chaperone function